MLSSKLGKLTLEGYMHFFFCLWSIAQKSIRSKDTIPKHVQSKYPPIRVINSDLQRKNGQGILNPKVWIYQPSSEYQKHVEACECSFSDKCRNLVKTPWDNSGVNKAKLGLAHYLFAKPPQLVRNWSWIKLGFGQRVKVVDPFLRWSEHTKLCFLLLNPRIGSIWIKKQNDILILIQSPYAFGIFLKSARFNLQV